MPLISCLIKRSTQKNHYHSQKARTNEKNINLAGKTKTPHPHNRLIFQLCGCVVEGVSVWLVVQSDEACGVNKPAVSGVLKSFVGFL